MTKQTVVFDLETIDAIAGMEKWHMEILKNLSGGIPAGTMNVFSAGPGKSMLNTYTMKVLKNRYYGATERTFWTDTNLCKEILFPQPAKPKYQFSRAKWYVADYNWQDYTEVMLWCAEQFGPHPRQHDAWSRWWDRYEGKVHFRDEKDYNWFVLRWGA